MLIALATDLDDGPAREHAAALAAALAARLVTIHIEPDDDLGDALVRAVRDAAPDLVVAGTHARHGFAAIVHGSIAELLARNIAVPTLVVPNHGRSLVRDGVLDVRRVVIPAAGFAEASHGIRAARKVAPDAAIELLHAGPLDPALGELGVETTAIDGPFEAELVAIVRTRDACLVVMPTRGHDSVVDIMRGSRTEHVIREVGCPVLSVPLC